MDKKVLMPLLVVMALVIAGLGYYAYQQKQANRDMLELADLDKKEMENQYQQFADQYSEMKTRINNDSIVAQLTREQLRTQQLLEELKQVKSTDAREITRLKRELAEVRAVLRSYVLQIDSLNRLNKDLRDENTRVRADLEERDLQNKALTSDNQSLTEKVAIAAQLDAANITITPKSKKGKAQKYMKDGHFVDVSFVIPRNVTAKNGMRTFYCRIVTPTGRVLNGGGTCPFENRNVIYSMKKEVEYTGKETPVTMIWEGDDYLGGGNYMVSIINDGHEIGSRTVTFKK